MAYYMEMERGSIDLAWIWNVGGTVARNVYSQRPDVMLVQHALNTVMAPLGLTNQKGEIITYLHRDGYIGPKTIDAIIAYQRRLASRGFLIKPNGSVDPSSRGGWTRDGAAQYTIVYLNREHVKVHGKMMEERDFPALLQANIQANRHMR
jgi:hypothetical protein